MSIVRIAIIVKKDGAQGTINLLNMLHARQYLINKAIGAETFRVPDAVIEAIGKKKPKTVDELLEAIGETGGELLGIECMEEGQVLLTFPDTENTEEIWAYAKLAELMAKKCGAARWVNPTERVKENEKYYFRTWLMQLGMVGEEYKIPRRVLLRNLSGIASFRTEDGLTASKDRQKAGRESMKAEKQTTK